MALEKRPTSLSKSCILIIVVASVERFAYKGVASNLVTYLTEVVHLSTSSAVKSVSNWTGITSMLPLLSAILADSYWDRYSTIMASSLLYILGLVALTSWALLYAVMPSSTLLVPLYLISVGQGGYNPSLQAFGADQLEIDDDLPYGLEDEKNKKNKKSLFFQWWYFGICSGSLMGNSIMSYIQDNVGWGLGFAIPTVAMAISVACFFCGARFYVRNQLKISSNRRESFIKAVKEAAKITKDQKICLPPRDSDAMELELQEKSLRSDFSDSKNSDQISSNSVEPPDVAKVILKLLPIWLSLLMFAVIFQQPTTFFTKQGMTMKHKIGNSFVIPPAILQSSITISIILLMPLYDKLIIPILRAITGNDKGINVLQRIGIGMLLSILAMVIAALVESKRLECVRKGPVYIQSSEMQLSIFWLLPQYILLGVSDVFTVVGMQEFFYTQVPSTMRTIGIALYLTVFGVGGFLSSSLISFIELVTALTGKDHTWFSDDLKESRLDDYYWFLALLSSISFLVFGYLCKYYKASIGSESVSHG